MKEQPNFGLIKRPSLKSESRSKLKYLGFDPIEQLVNIHQKLEKEEQYYSDLRRNVANGTAPKGLRYSYIAHVSVLNQLQDVSNKLLRYRYARVPETTTIDSSYVPAFSINLSGIDSGES